MSRYQDEDDLLVHVGRIAKRVGDLERTNPLNQGTIDRGNFTLNVDGNLTTLFGSFFGRHWDLNTNAWAADDIIGISIYNPGDVNPYFQVGRADAAGTLDAIIGFAGAGGSGDQRLENLFAQANNVFIAGNYVTEATRLADRSYLALDAGGHVYLASAVGDISLDAADDIFISPTDGLIVNCNNVDINATGAAANIDLSADTDIILVSQGNTILDPQGSGELQFYIGTTTNPANLNQTSNNIRQVSSARKYKSDIQDTIINPADVLKLRPRTWIDKGELEKDPNYKERTVGFVAEEVAEQESLHPLIQFNDDGTVESLYYDRFTVALIELAKAQQKQIDDLTKRVVALEKKVK